MLKYAKIIDEKTKEVQVGAGCPDSYYREIGMIEMDVDQAYNGNWYVHGYAPAEPEPTVDEKKIRVRWIRNGYLKEGVDPYQLVIRWNTLTPKEQQCITEYRQYLLDYPESSVTWYENNPDDYETWRQKHYPEA